MKTRKEQLEIELAYENGAEIEFFNRLTDEWNVTFPSSLILEEWDYRVKKDSNTPICIESSSKIVAGEELDKGDLIEIKNGKAYKVKNELPKTMSSLFVIDSDFVDNHDYCNIYRETEDDSTEEVFFQLIILRDYYRQGWEPNWNDGNIKHCISFESDELVRIGTKHRNSLLSFQSMEVRDHFSNNFEDLIIKAKPLLG